MEECLRNVQPESSQCVTDDTRQPSRKRRLDNNSSHRGVPVAFDGAEMHLLSTRRRARAGRQTEEQDGRNREESWQHTLETLSNNSFCISPVELSCSVIYSQSIGPAQRAVKQNQPLRSIQVSGHPVNSNAIWVVDLRGNQHHGIAAINVGSADGPNLIIRPIDVTLNWVIVYSYGMANVIDLHEQRNNDKDLKETGLQWGRHSCRKAALERAGRDDYSLHYCHCRGSGLQSHIRDREGQAWMERVCQSVQYKVSSDSVRAKGWVRVPSTTVSLQEQKEPEEVRLFDGLFTDICPKYQALGIQEVHRCCILEVTNNDGRLTPHALGIDQSHVTPVGKQEESCHTEQSLWGGLWFWPGRVAELLRCGLAQHVYCNPSIKTHASVRILFIPPVCIKSKEHRRYWRFTPDSVTKSLLLTFSPSPSPLFAHLFSCQELTNNIFSTSGRSRPVLLSVECASTQTKEQPQCIQCMQPECTECTAVERENTQVGWANSVFVRPTQIEDPPPKKMLVELGIKPQYFLVMNKICPNVSLPDNTETLSTSRQRHSQLIYFHQQNVCVTPDTEQEWLELPRPEKIAQAASKLPFCPDTSSDPCCEQKVNVPSTADSRQLHSSSIRPPISSPLR
ncbi:hypothetical protein F7725_022236, partial [Dissostichus mawsoni]